MSQPPNSISISSAVLAQLIHVTNMQTDTHTDYATSDICSNRPHLCTVCRQCGQETKFSYHYC